MGRNVVIRFRFPIGISSPNREEKKAQRLLEKAAKEAEAANKQ
jgi:hypothetical protein